MADEAVVRIVLEDGTGGGGGGGGGGGSGGGGGRSRPVAGQAMGPDIPQDIRDARRQMEREARADAARAARMQEDPAYRTRQEEKQRQSQQRENEQEQRRQQKEDEQEFGARVRAGEASQKEKQRGGALDSALSFIEPIRGVIGGAFGAMTGALLDILVALNKSQVEAGKEKTQQDQLAEQKRTTRAVEALGGGRGGGPSGTAADITGRVGGGPPAGPGGFRGRTPENRSTTAIDRIIAFGAQGAGTDIAGGASTSEAITGGISGSVAAASAAIVAAVMAFKLAADQLDRSVSKYAEYNPQIAQAQAMAEIRETMGDMRRAQQMSGELVKYIQAKSDLQQAYEDIKVKALTSMAPAMTSMLDSLNRMLPILETVMDLGSASLRLIADLTQLVTEGLGFQKQAREDQGYDWAEALLAPIDKNPFFKTGEEGGAVPGF
jgi:hypothetical protein